MTKSEFDQPHEADGLSAPICSRVLSVLHAEVLGIYLFGSLATNDFDEGVSDIDVLVVTARDLNESELSQLGVMHVDLVARPQWKDRIEVIYLSAAALQSFRAERSPLSVTSPGEPFHTIDAGREWLVNWFNVQQSGKMLFGPSPRTLIPTITVQEVQEELRDHLLGWQSRVRTGSGQGFLAYAILTVCRAWCTITHKTVRSKVQSGALVGQEFPQWAELVNQAVEVRANRGHDGDINPDDAARFVDDIARHLVGASWDGGR